MRLNSGRNIQNGGKPYIIAELNSSHNGKFVVAKEMVNAAKECGCDAVKFQSWSSESLYCQDYYEQNPMSKRMVNAFSLKAEELMELKNYCKEIHIDFSSTPYCEDEVDFLVKDCEVPFIKIASMDIDNLPFLRYVAKQNVPIILSTGMATLKEIEAAVFEIESMGNDNLCILHCVSLYPVEAEGVNLNNILMLREKFPKYAVGYSDHTIGNEVACAAVGMGAAVIEKHFTLNSKKIGWDNQMATEPAEMKELVKKCHSVYKSLGNYDRMLTTDELEQRKRMRRSIVATKDISKGHVIEESDITAKRPGTGIPISEYKTVIGKELLENVHKDQLLQKEDMLEVKRK